MANDLLDRVRAAVEQSELLRAVASVRQDGGLTFALGDATVRPLSAAEVAALEAQGNTAEDWSRVRVADGFDARRVRQSSFHGDVVLGRFAGHVEAAGGLRLPGGVYGSTVAGCVVGHDALVRDVRLLANYVVGEGALLLDCGKVVCRAETAFGNGVVLPVALESGGRDVQVFAELDVETAAALARPGRCRDFTKQYQAVMADYLARVVSPRGIVGPRARVCNTPTVQDTYVGPYAVVDGATSVADSTLLGGEDEPARVESGACVRGALLQWGSRVSTLALVENAVLTEHSHVEHQGKVTNSILGPNTGVGAGEVASCLLGPFVNCHHQSLLISTYWPQGRGNLSYGANVGSNHTSRAPDQEFWAGEGLFLGLGVIVKFPADFSRAPYSVIAAGVSTLPQRVTLPFSLVMPSSASYPGVPPALNEIVPAWMLSDNLYALKRNEVKYQQRNRARRTHFAFEVLRPETVDLMRDAVRHLETVRQVKELYTDRDFAGVGKNVLLENNRRAAVEAYRFFIRYYALLGLREQVQALLDAGRPEEVAGLLDREDTQPVWEHQRRLLRDELGLTDVLAGLRELPDMLDKVAAAVERSKVKDEQRGVRIIEDYAEVHKPAAEDELVRQAWGEAHRLQQEVRSAVAALEACRPTKPVAEWPEHAGGGAGRPGAASRW